MLKKIMLLSFCFTFLLISACTTVTRSTQDGPPPGHVDLSKIHDAVPRELPLSHYGNNSYVVRGKRYYVLKSAKGYDRRGIASWYGTKFHGHRASDGEKYDMLSMSGAMLDIPIPSFVQVTNLENNRKVIVEVNDRGPFERNRLIDLSYAAAAKLGVYPRGTALVEVKGIDPRTWGRNDSSDSNQYAAAEPTTHHLTQRVTQRGKQKLYLQVGAYKTKGSAERILARIHNITKEPVRIAKNPHSLYRVQVGPLASVNMSDIVHQRLTQSGFEHTVTVIQ